MSSLFDNHHRIKEWEDAVSRDDRIQLYAVYYVPGKNVLDHATGTVRVGMRGNDPICRFVSWHHNGMCYNGKQRLPEYDLTFDD